jgi:plasmid stability protein
VSLTITITDLDETTEGWLNAEAARAGKSIEELVRQILRNSVTLEQPRAEDQIHHDLDELAGTWSAEDTDEFLAAIADFEQVDVHLWQ